MYKLVILDYDGTIFGKSGVVTDAVKNAITKTIQKGVKVSLSTGRSAYSVLYLIKELHLDLPHVFLAGALVYNPIKDLVILEDPIEKSAVLSANDFCRENNLYLESSTKNMLYYNLPIDFFINRRKRISGEPSRLTDLSKLVEKENVLNMRIFLMDEQTKKAYDNFQKSLSDKLNFQIGYANDDSLEVVNMTSLEVSKVSALRHLCQYLKIEPHETIAIGDSPIDLPLIENVGLGIAMGNASQSVQSKAKWVCPSVEQDGVAVALEKFIL